jgi:hypothetical protein
VSGGTGIEERPGLAGSVRAFGGQGAIRGPMFKEEKGRERCVNDKC